MTTKEKRNFYERWSWIFFISSLGILFISIGNYRTVTPDCLLRSLLCSLLIMALAVGFSSVGAGHRAKLNLSGPDEEHF